VRDFESLGCIILTTLTLWTLCLNLNISTSVDTIKTNNKIDSGEIW
jgi:hypothetical protein